MSKCTQVLRTPMQAVGDNTFTLDGPRTLGWAHIGHVITDTSRVNPASWTATIFGQVVAVWSGPVSPRIIVQGGEVLQVSSDDGVGLAEEFGWPLATQANFVGVSDMLVVADLSAGDAIPPLPIPVPTPGTFSFNITATGTYDTAVGVTPGSEPVAWIPRRVEIYAPAGAVDFGLRAETAPGAANGPPLIADYISASAIASTLVIPLSTNAAMGSGMSYAHLDVYDLAGTSPTLLINAYWDGY